MAVEIRKMATASPEELVTPALAKIVSELPSKQKLLEDVTRQVNESGSFLSGVDVDSMSHQDFIKLFDEFDLSE